MSTEKKIIKPFEGLGKLEKIASKIELVVAPPNKRPDRLSSKNGRIFNSEFGDHRSLGLTVVFSSSREELKTALFDLDLTLDEVDVLAVFDSPFLRNREVRELGNCAKLPDTIELVATGGRRSSVFEDRRHPLEVKVCFILRDERKPKPLSPYRKGSLLAECEFTIRPLAQGNGLSPRPLDEQTRVELRLPSSTELYIQAERALLDLETFEEDFTIWWNEDLHQICANSSGSLQNQYVKSVLNSALVQIVYMVSAELKETSRQLDDLENEPPMIIKMLEKVFENLNASDLIRGSSFLSKLKSKPELIAAVFSGHDDYVNSWKVLFDPDQDLGDKKS